MEEKEEKVFQLETNFHRLNNLSSKIRTSSWSVLMNLSLCFGDRHRHRHLHQPASWADLKREIEIEIEIHENY